jgi:cysteine-rich repeat protein
MDHRRAIALCSLGDSNCIMLQTNASRFNFIITRLDPALVYATLRFSHTYDRPGVYSAYFEGCCRSRKLFNNAGLSFHLRASVDVFAGHSCPQLTLPAVLSMPRASQFTILAAHLPGTAHVAYRLGTADEMGFAMDRKLSLPWGVDAPGPFLAPNGVVISPEGVISLDADGPAGCAGGCLLQVSIIAYTANASTAVDLVIEVVTSEGPRVEEAAFLATPHSSPSTPVVIHCDSTDFMPPEYSTWRVSDCVDLEQVHDFDCNKGFQACEDDPSFDAGFGGCDTYVRGFSNAGSCTTDTGACERCQCACAEECGTSPSLGVCPDRDYAFVHPYNSPVYRNCFTAERCQANLDRVFCAEVTEHGQASDFLRTVFQPADGTYVRYIRQVNDFPSGVQVLDGECSRRMAGGTCEGLELMAGRDAPNKFIDIRWRPKCADPSQIGLWGLCFVAEDSNGKLSLPACAYIRVVANGTLDSDLLSHSLYEHPSFYGFTYEVPLMPTDSPQFYPFTSRSPTDPGNIMQMVMYRQPSHIIAGEPFIVQPQVAFLDSTGALLTGLTMFAYTVEATVSPESLHPEAELTGNHYAHIEKGIAVFTDLALGKEGVGYMLRIRAQPHGTVFQIDTPRFSVLPGAVILKMGTQPRKTTAGHPIQGPPKVFLMDFDGNYAAISSKRVKVSLLTLSTTAWCEGTQACNATLYGQSEVNAVYGAATFDDVKIAAAGTYSMVFQLGSFQLTSSTFVVKAGRAALFFVSQQPCALPCRDPDNMHQVANDLFTTSIEIKDSFYNPLFFEDGVSYPNATVSLSRFPSNFRSFASHLSGTLQVQASSQRWGVLGYTFPDLFIKEQGFYSIKFKVFYTHITNVEEGATQPFISNSSLVFDVTLPVETLSVLTPPGTSTAGNFVEGPPTFALLDFYGFRTASQRNSWLVLDSTDAIFSCAAPCLDPSKCISTSKLYNDTCRQKADIVAGKETTPSDGKATFPTLIVNRAGVNYSLTMFSSQEISKMTEYFTVEHNAPHELVVARLPLKKIISEPFGVQPLVALVDEYGNICLKESTSFVEAVLISNSGDGNTFFLAGVPKIRLRNGVADFHNLGVDASSIISDVTRHQLRFKCQVSVSSTDKSVSLRTLNALSIDFEVLPGVMGLSILTPPSKSEAGSSLQGPPSVRGESTNGNVLELSNRTISARIVEADCPERYPVPAPVLPRIVQTELRGSVPLVPMQAFILTKFRAVGIWNYTERAFVKVIDAAYDCGSNQSNGDLGARQSLVCYNDGTCASEDDTSVLYLTFNVSTIQAISRLRVCARAAGEKYSLVSVVLQQLGTWKLWTTMPMVEYVDPLRMSAEPYRPQPIDHVTLWWAGRDFDTCHAFRTSASDARVAFVLSRDVLWKRSHDYSCPRHPLTGQIYRWASSEEVQALGTLFTPRGEASTIYSSASCGPQSASVLFGRQAFLFSDFARIRVYAKADRRENQALVSGMPHESNVAGLVCVSDEVVLECTEKCHYGRCPEPDVQPGHVDEDQLLVMRWSQHADEKSGAVISPLITSYLRSDVTGNTIYMASGKLTFHLRLGREPASWVTVAPNASPRPDLVTWEPGARFQNDTWDSGVRFIFGSHGMGWNYSRHEHRTTHEWDSFVSHEITCGTRCSEWPSDVTVKLVYTIYSTVQSYSGTRVVIHLRKVPDTAGMAADIMGSLAIFEDDLPFLQTPPPPPPPVEQTPAPGPRLDFCIRAGARWGVGGDPKGTEMCEQALNYKCGTVWCGEYVKQIGAGGYHSCAIDQDGKLLCWGRNNTGQSGLPWEVQVSKVILFDAGTYHTCALLGDKRLVCWGDSLRGQTDVPNEVSAWRAVSCGTAHTCGIAEDGRGYCWGDNTYEQSAVPEEAMNLTSISAGFFHTCAVGVSGEGHCWGSRHYGYGQIVLPVQGPWKQISAGNLHTCGILSNGTALCWGLADGKRTAVPTIEEGISWVQLSAGLVHSCGVTSDSRMHCWGSEALNRLLIKPRPQGPWARVSAGYEHSCGLLESGRIACWGSAGYGQLAVSAVQFVSFYPPCAHLQSSLDGHHACNADEQIHVSVVDVSMSVLTAHSTILYTVDSGFTSAAVASPSKYSEPLRFDVSVSLTAWAKPPLDDAEVAESDKFSHQFTVKVGLPVISIRAPNAAGAPYYYTSVEVFMAGDASMNPFSSTKIYYTTDGSDPNSNSGVEYQPVQGNHSVGVVLGSQSADQKGVTNLKVIAKRDGADASETVSKEFTTKVAPLRFEPGNVSAQMVTSRGINVSISTSTPDTRIFYAISRPSQRTDPSDPTDNSTLFSRNFVVNETGTVVRAIGYKDNLATSDVAEVMYTLQLERPDFVPPPNSTTGFLAPLILNIMCKFGGSPRYSLDDSEPSHVFSSPLYLRNLTAATVRAICVSQQPGMIKQSEETKGIYNISLLDLLDSPITESSTIARDTNTITVSIRTTMGIVQGTTITISGLLGSTSPDSASMLLSRPGLRGQWTRATGTLVATVDQPPSSAELVFAVTTADHCAESLPFGVGYDCDPRFACDAHINSWYLDVAHGGWMQEFYVNGTSIMKIEYDFYERCTLRERLTPSEGPSKCNNVVWRVTYKNTVTQMTGVYQFSQLGRSAMYASYDDGAWGAADGEQIISNGPRPHTFWGQGVFDSADSEPWQCDALYTGDSNDPIRSDSLRSVLKLTAIDSALVFSFQLENPAEAQTASTPQIAMQGRYCDALGCKDTTIGPKPMAGAVLGANTSFGLSDASVQQTDRLPGATSIVSIALKTNIKLSPDLCGLPHCSIQVSNLPGLQAGSSVRVGRATVPETKAVSFECNGYRSCQALVENYLPEDAIFVSADLDVFIACSDFDSAGEIVETLTIDGSRVASITEGPWEGCEAACGVEKPVLSGYSVSHFSAGAIPIYLAVSQDVDSYSCSQTSTSFVRARVVVNVRYYYEGNYTIGPAHDTGSISYLLRNVNVDPGCVDGFSTVMGSSMDANEWRDSSGYRCKDYAAFKWCDDTGTCGGEEWNCKDFAVDEISARHACCACGGGQRWWTRVSFETTNSMSGEAREPRVAVLRANGVALLNQTLEGRFLGNPDAPSSQLRSESDETYSSLDEFATRTSTTRRRLLSQETDQCTVNATLQIMWPPEDTELYTCCWSELERQVAKGVAETIITTLTSVEVSLSDKSDSGVLLVLSVAGDSKERCVGMANNLRPSLVARALLSQHLRVEAEFTEGGSPVVYDSLGSEVAKRTVKGVGYSALGDWYDANFAGFRDSTEIAYLQQWETGRVLTSNHSVISLGGVATFPNVIVNKACPGYRLRLFTVISGSVILNVTSDAFLVQAGPAAKLYVSPVPTMVAGSSRWPCWNNHSCPGTIVVAGMYFAVTATVVDSLNNTCLDEEGSVRVELLSSGAESATVYGDNEETLQHGSRVLNLRIQKAYPVTSPAQLTLNYMPKNLRAESQTFAVHAAPLSTMQMEAPALHGHLFAGDLMSPPLRLLMWDAYGNQVLEFLEVSANLLNEPEVLLGDLTEIARDGEAKFSRIYIEKAASKYSMVFSCEGVVSVSRAFSVLHAKSGPCCGGTLKIDRSPANAVAGEAFTVQPRVGLFDAYGNLAIDNMDHITVSAGGLEGNTIAYLVKGFASFHDLVLMSSGPQTLTFQLTGSPTDGNISVEALIDVDPSLQQLSMVQQPKSAMARSCLMPYPALELLSEDSRLVNHSRKVIKADIAVNVFRVTGDLTCGSGGCFASTSFRYFMPEKSTLERAYLDVDVAKTDFDEDEEYVEYILINGVRWTGDNASLDGRCDPQAADMCFSYHKCVSKYDVSDFARDNYLTVTTKISAAVNDFCAPRLKARVQLYGNYRPHAPETATMVQDQPSVPLGGITSLVANGRSLVFKDLFFPVPGFGYRLRFSADDGKIQYETNSFDIYDTANRADFVRQPGAAMAGEPLRTQPVVQYLDQFNNLVASYEPIVNVTIGTAQKWMEPEFNGGTGGWQDMTQEEKPVLAGLLIARAERGVVEFVNITVDRPVKRLSLVIHGCMVIPGQADICMVVESMVFEVAPPVQHLTISSYPASIKAGRMVSANLLLDNGDSRPQRSRATVDVSAFDASGNDPVQGQVSVAAFDGAAMFSDFYFVSVGEFNVTFKVDLSAVVGSNSITALTKIQVEAGDPVSIDVLDNSVINNAVQFDSLTAGQPFAVQVQILDAFGNRVRRASGYTPVARKTLGSTYDLFEGNAAEPPASGLIKSTTEDGVARFHLRLDVANSVTVHFDVALSPDGDCSELEIADASSVASDCPADPRGLQFCAQGDGLDETLCLGLPLCSYIAPLHDCRYFCSCPQGVRPAHRWCSACVASTSLDVRLYASVSSGTPKLSMRQQPKDAIDELKMHVQPIVLVQVCTEISNECNPIKDVTVYAHLKSAQDDCTAVGLPICTNLFMQETHLVCSQESQNCTAVSDADGVATFEGLGVDSPGSDGATNVVIGFSALSTMHEASALDLMAQENWRPKFEAPTPLTCDDDDTPLVYYASVGSRLDIILNASDTNTAPFDELGIEIQCSVQTSPSVVDCDRVLPLNAYFSENIYSSADTADERYHPACDVDKTSPKQRSVRRKNRVMRQFVWSPVAWYPMLSLRYRSVEALRTGAQAAEQLSTCERTVNIVVCDRPRFVDPSPMPPEGRLMALAKTEIVFTVAAVDRNEDDVVEIIVEGNPDDEKMSMSVGANLPDVSVLVTGLEVIHRNRVSRHVRLLVQDDGLTHTVCFRARDNQFPCDDGYGLVSEDKLCVHCSMEPLGLFATCHSTIMAESLDRRLAPVVCGDGRMTDEEECDDGNLESGDGCSSLCKLEEGYEQSDTDPLPEFHCGDGLVVIGETCDDKNNAMGDGCSATCSTEEGFTCLECGDEGTRCNPTCGDGLVKLSEECDDSNTANGDGCDLTCRIEDGWNMTLGGVLTPICGDGKIRGDEECDDGNLENDDGCNDRCVIEENFNCGDDGCKSICGDGVRTKGEQCDDGNLDDGDGCDSVCHVETFFVCTFGNLTVNGTREPDFCREICGDGERVQSNQTKAKLAGFYRINNDASVDRINDCDDGNNIDGDGCSSECKVETYLGWECEDNQTAAGNVEGPRSACSARCGDGMRTNEEECDDGNMLSRDGCSSTCTVETGYVCSLGTAGAEAQMRMLASSCIKMLDTNRTCCFGDGNVTYAKTCLDGVHSLELGLYCLDEFDLCSSSQCERTVGKSKDICYMAYMGVASLDFAMTNMDNVSDFEMGKSDSCTSSCGDGHRALQEECDDDNLEPGDGCSPDCKIESGWYCLHKPGPVGDDCSTICGDAVLVPGVEECDDGAWTEASGDGCTSSCKLEVGFNCTYDSQNRIYGGRCKPICGDGRWVLGEACDDENTVNDDGCSSECEVEDGWVCGADSTRPDMNTSVCIGLCGDGIKVSGEECDDNNIKDNDGCTSSCRIEPGFSCLENGDCYTVCGDGVVIGKESCDDGNSINGDGCSEDCLIEHGYQCIQATCTESGCTLQEGGLGSYCQECPPVRQTAVRCSHPPCPAIGLTADCENWQMSAVGGWIRKEDMPVSSYSINCKPEWYGDGFCDALNNQETCGFDGGDCCSRSCECGGASSRACYNGIMGGCGKFKGKKGDYRCIETGENLAADVAMVNLIGDNIGAGKEGPYLSWVQVELSASQGLDIYFSIDEKLPAEETTTQLLIHGQKYVGPFNLTANTRLLASTVAWGLGVGQMEQPIKVQVEKPSISPSPAAGEIMQSPVLVSIASKTPGATVKYRISDSDASQALGEVFEYTIPFAVDSASTVTAWAEKAGVQTSEMTSESYLLRATTPDTIPAPGSYLQNVVVNVSTETVQANVYVTVCRASEYPGWANKSTGEIYQTNADFYCFPDCRGLCSGGFNDGKPCGGSNDLTTCSGGGTCVQSYRMVRLCYPHEWPPGRFVYSRPIVINQTTYGTGAWVTSFVTRRGMADSNFSTQQYNITTDNPTLHVLKTLHPTLPFPDGPEPVLSVPFTEHGKEAGPFPSPLYFNFSTPAPATVYYTLDGSIPSPGAPGTRQVFSQGKEALMAPITLNRSATMTWLGIAENLAPSDIQSYSIAVQALPPQLIMNVRFFDKTGGIQQLMEYESNLMLNTKEVENKGIVMEGFAYPGVGMVVVNEAPWDPDAVQFGSLREQNLFEDRPPPPIPRMHGYPMFSIRPITQDADTYYRVANGTNSSLELPTWPSIGVRSGVGEPDTVQGLRARGWERWTGSSEQAIFYNVTIELMSASLGSTLINSNILTYPIFIREKCGAGASSTDGYGPCVLCPLDTYMTCSNEQLDPPCTCKRCNVTIPGTGTFQVGSPSIESCWPFCLPGTFSRYEGVDANRTNCTQCALGTYNSDMRATSCTACPVGTSTWRYGAEGIHACRGSGGIVAGGFHSCGIDVEGSAKCWGYNGFGQSDVPKKVVKWEENGVPYVEKRDDSWLQVAAGSFHSCGITTSREAKCWGQEFVGKTVVPTMHLYDSPEMPLQEIQEWQAISTSAGYHHACGIADRRAVCWGDDEYQQTRVPKGRYWRSISAGQFHSCAVDSNGEAVCWGDDSYGQSDVPIVVNEGPWRNVSAGHFHSCGVTSVGKMHCWGSSLYEATAFPQDVEAWSSVAVGRFHSCGLTSDGSMRCWGSNQDGAISVPEHLLNAKWRAVTCGLFHSCGITEDRTGVCWGRSVYGLTNVPEAAWSSV